MKAVQDQVRELVRSVWSGHLGLSDDAPLLEGGVNAVDLRTLANLVEEQFIIDVHEDEIDDTHFGSIARLAAYVNAKLAALQTCRIGSAMVWHRDIPRDIPPLSSELLVPSSRDHDPDSTGTESAA
ncbi:hypothetical protein [Chondromyces apiculatus]|uniref:Carrier domain-containing protein n=1 Tax=Chondromyces apiculatus DSM 436 TaxID=1192034 RepID=A0A017TF85_9BACT|nr:hypothetical protein [Chondromyces apiculatus]EYF07909.1 Hypothetical protein CAP_6931 [Chondromyces apiculatus DSM 436]